MKLKQRVAEWLDIRPEETGQIVLSFASAFFVISFLTLARSIREALYLSRFSVDTLPYVTVAGVALGVPAVGAFIRLVSHRSPHMALRRLILALALAVSLLWSFLAHSGMAVVAFYLLTSVGALLLTSGFWVITSELFALRSAKRLFGFIGAGGTLGAMVTGLSTGRLMDLLGGDIPLVAVLLVFLAGLALLQHLIPKPAATAARTGTGRTPILTALRVLRSSRHLRLIALIVFMATFATTLLDFQFKELVQARLTSGEELTAFFGSFYGWAGGVALAIQLLITARLLSGAGVTRSVAVLPMYVLVGAMGLLAAPSLVLVTLVRGGDYSLRKSLFRSVTEFLYVPVPTDLRRRAKTFIDSMVDGAGEGVAAVAVFLWVTLAGFPSRFLSVGIVAATTLLLILARRIGKEYLHTIQTRLKTSSARSDTLDSGHQLGRDPLGATFTRLDVTRMIQTVGPEGPPAALAALAALESGKLGDGTEAAAEVKADPADAISLDAILMAADPAEVAGALVGRSDWEARHATALSRWLARDRLVELVTTTLTSLGEETVPALSDVLGDSHTDFVIRRRIPRVLARIPGQAAGQVLLGALSADRFEIRYWAGVGLARRRRGDGAETAGGSESREDEFELSAASRDTIWQAIRAEVSRERPVWELQRLLDDRPDFGDDFVEERVDTRGELSMEHTFRLLSLVLDPLAVRSAYHGIRLDQPEFRSFSLEYLSQVLPPDIQLKLWPFIGDAGALELKRSERSLDSVVADLMQSGATLFGGKAEQQALRRLIEDRFREEGQGEPGKSS